MLSHANHPAWWNQPLNYKEALSLIHLSYEEIVVNKFILNNNRCMLILNLITNAYMNNSSFRPNNMPTSYFLYVHFLVLPNERNI